MSSVYAQLALCKNASSKVRSQGGRIQAPQTRRAACSQRLQTCESGSIHKDLAEARPADRHDNYKIMLSLKLVLHCWCTKHLFGIKGHAGLLRTVLQHYQFELFSNLMLLYCKPWCLLVYKRLFLLAALLFCNNQLNT